ncbi:MAG: hypothetical protein WA419_11145 [Silvibacterium sp.]
MARLRGHQLLQDVTINYTNDQTKAIYQTLEGTTGSACPSRPSFLLL